MSPSSTTMQVRRRRSTTVQSSRKDKKERKDTKDRSLPTEESAEVKEDPGQKEDEPLAIEDQPFSAGILPLEDAKEELRLPLGTPEVLGPKRLEPLFNQEQLDKMEALEKQAPMLMARAGRTGSAETQQLSLQEGQQVDPGQSGEGAMVPFEGMDRLEETMKSLVPAMTNSLMPTPIGQVVTPGSIATSGMFPQVTPGYPELGQWQEEQARRQWQLHSEVRMVAQTIKQLQEENLVLRVQLMEEREQKYSTPPEEPPKGKAAGSKSVWKTSKAVEDGKVSEKRKEAAQEKKAAPAPTVKPSKKDPEAAPSTPKEDAPPSREGGEQDKKDGPPSRGGSKERRTVPLPGRGGSKERRTVPLPGRGGNKERRTVPLPGRGGSKARRTVPLPGRGGSKEEGKKGDKDVPMEETAVTRQKDPQATHLGMDLMKKIRAVKKALKALKVRRKSEAIEDRSGKVEIELWRWFCSWCKGCKRCSKA